MVARHFRTSGGYAESASMKVLPATDQAIARASEIIRAGGLVVIPTETVYGVACDATNPEAARRIFEVKCRPADNPLIVHVSSVAQAKGLSSRWPPQAQILVERFWPGPLTLVVEKSPSVPSEVVAGLSTVAIRMPSHSVALMLIEASERPLAAPSANRFMRLSATRVENVDADLIEKADLVLDGGPCEVGLESTVVDVTVSPPRILRPGAISRGEIQAALGVPLGSIPPEAVRTSPGMYRRHYAPRAKLDLVKSLADGQTGLTFGEPICCGQIKMPMDPAAYGAALYDALFRLDKANVTTIYVEMPPDTPDWEAVWDRLRKASAYDGA